MFEDGEEMSWCSIILVLQSKNRWQGRRELSWKGKESRMDWVGGGGRSATSLRVVRPHVWMLMLPSSETTASAQILQEESYKKMFSIYLFVLVHRCNMSSVSVRNVE